MVRVGDVFESGVVVTAPDAGPDPITVSIKATTTKPSAEKTNLAATAERTELEVRRRQKVLGDAVTLLPTSPFFREVQLSATEQQRTVRFRFSARAVGETGLRFDAFLGSDAAGKEPVDSASFDVPVLGRQRPVFVATSFALQPGAGGDGQVDGLALPDADPGTGSIDLLAGVGNLPFLKVCAHNPRLDWLQGLRMRTCMQLACACTAR